MTSLDFLGGYKKSPQFNGQIPAIFNLPAFF